jgi:hypothetical protein
MTTVRPLSKRSICGFSGRTWPAAALMKHVRPTKHKTAFIRFMTILAFFPESSTLPEYPWPMVLASNVLKLLSQTDDRS